MSTTDLLSQYGGSAARALGLPGAGVLTLTGGGGKTTLMYRLARELVGEGKRVVCTTSTKIFEPEAGQVPYLVVENDTTDMIRACREGTGRFGWMVIARARVGNGKLDGFASGVIGELFASGEVDWIIVEGDGARMLPLKAPVGNEPVFPESTTHAVAVVGLNGVGTPLDEDHVCRCEQYSELTGLPLHSLVTVESVARVLDNDLGLLKGAPGGCLRLAWLNQADLPGNVEAGRKVMRRVRTINRIVLGAAAEIPGIFEVQN